ncbi:MAG: DapH/DapD/GlmU-related protein, partial [Pseudomonadota bacterium]
MASKRWPVTLPFGDVTPVFGGAIVFAGPGSAVLGRVDIGPNAWIGPSAVVRADGHFVRIGREVFLGRGATVHIAHEVYPALIGDGVTAEAGAVIHACEIGDNVCLGRDVIVLDGSVIGPGAVLSAGSVVFPGTRLEGGWLYAGRPAKPVRHLSTGELVAYHAHAREAVLEAAQPETAWKTASTDLFVAATAHLSGEVVCGEGVGIWYGCRLDAGAARITIGTGSNVQDNATLACSHAGIEIGADVTIGHNAKLADCRIGPRSLIGIGATIADGVEIAEDVLLAAG